jgi:hypothetical protein
MSQKEPSKIGQLLAGCYCLFLIVCAALLIFVLCYWAVKLSLVILAPDAAPIQQLEEAVDALPDGTLKFNIYTILAAEYAGDSQDLNQILQMYSEMKIKELQNGKDPL